MAKLHCFVCGKDSETRLDLPCPHCKARGKWAQPVEDFKDDSGRKIDPKNQCPDGLLHDFRPVKGGTKGQRCIKCGLTEEDINKFFSRKGITFHGG